MTARARTGDTTNDAGKERRQHDRVPTRLPLDADVEGQRFQIETSNLSAGGAYCHSDRRFPVMARLEVSVDLPSDRGGELLRFAAVVVRCVKDGAHPGGWNLALFFPDLDPAARIRLAQFVQAHQAGILEADPGPHRKDS
jgi:hypothetical protein